MASNYIDLPETGGGGGSGVSSLNTLTGALTLVAGSGITITPGSGTLTIASAGGSGTVTSVGLTLPSIFTVTGSPVTSSGTLAGTLNAQTANTVFAGPTNAAPNTPTFRALVNSDVAALTVANITAISNSTLTTLSALALPFGQVIGGTSGSVIFSNGTTLTQNNANFFWDNTALALGIGTIPAAAAVLDVVANTAVATQVEQLTGYGANNIGIRIRHARGTVSSPTGLLSGDPLGFIGSRGYGTSQFAASNTGSIQFAATENFSNTANGTSIVFNTTPNGSVTLAQAMLLTSTGLTLAGTVPLILSGATSGTFTLKAAVTTASYAVIMPAAQGAASTIPVNDGTGQLTWTAFPTPYVVSTIAIATAGVSGTTYLTNTSGGSFTVTLPAPVSGAFVAIKDSTGSFQTNPVTIAPHASEMIEGLASSKLLQTNWGAWSFFSDGTNWFMGPF